MSKTECLSVEYFINRTEVEIYMGVLYVVVTEFFMITPVQCCITAQRGGL